MEARLEALDAAAFRERDGALRELRAGQKQGHWIWYVFPTLSLRGGDRFSAAQPGAPDLQTTDEAAAYAAHAALRGALLAAFGAADAAFSEHGAQAPWRVLDASFGRSADGAWLRGPVDSFKCRCCATLFAVTAQRNGDVELCRASLAVLSHFRPGEGMLYKDGGRGTAGFVEGRSPEMVELAGPDEFTLRLLGVTNWAEIAASGTAT